MAENIARKVVPVLLTSMDGVNAGNCLEQFLPCVPTTLVPPVHRTLGVFYDPVLPI